MANAVEHGCAQGHVGMQSAKLDGRVGSHEAQGGRCGAYAAGQQSHGRSGCVGWRPIAHLKTVQNDNEMPSKTTLIVRLKLHIDPASSAKAPLPYVA